MPLFIGFHIGQDPAAFLRVKHKPGFTFLVPEHLQPADIVLAFLNQARGQVQCFRNITGILKTFTVPD
ncbi:hypothetical protein CDQ75_09415, partial [Campylobacter hyointestinalis subsp. hyointestinalis]